MQILVTLFLAIVKSEALEAIDKGGRSGLQLTGKANLRQRTELPAATETQCASWHAATARVSEIWTETKEVHFHVIPLLNYFNSIFY